MTLPATALTDTTTLEGDLGITAGTQTATLELMINAASQAVLSYLNRDSLIYEAAIVEKVAGTRETYIYVSRTPIDTVTAISIDAGTLSLDPSTWWVTNNDAGEVYLRGGWPRLRYHAPNVISPTEVVSSREKNITITYSGGWVTPGQYALDNTLTRTLPYDIELATLSIASTLYNERGMDQRVRMEKVMSASFQYGARSGAASELVTGIAEGLLAPYRRYAA